MQFQDILTTYYSKEFNQGLFRFTFIDGQIVLDAWEVPGIPQPTHDEVMALETPQLELQFNSTKFFERAIPIISQHIESVAMARQYDSAASCTSYLNSSNPAWAADAKAFSEWRDSVWTYAISQQGAITSGQIPIPEDANALIAQLPLMVWPSA